MLVTREEFEGAVKSCGYPSPPADVYEHLIEETREHGFSREELAMFLAQLIHQSQGFQRREDGAAVAEDYADESDGRPGKSYYGRGYILLTWASNYKAASQDLGLGEQLIKEPEAVARDGRLAMRVSVWFWDKVVRAETQGEENCFGATTRSINGFIECSGGFHPVAHERWQKYLKVAGALGIRDRAEECGCYN
uniref:Putative endochitinase 3 n=1 Tax=Tachinaephagus zealandicus TaxID=543383 RepID=A0A0U3SWJ5_9HYME|nr:putative endochitinase 3 [Tachinaephagus zealandicus]